MPLVTESADDDTLLAVPREVARQISNLPQGGSLSIRSEVHNVGTGVLLFVIAHVPVGGTGPPDRLQAWADCIPGRISDIEPRRCLADVDDGPYHSSSDSHE